MEKVLWFSRLQPGVEPESYEQFVRQVDYPATERISSIIEYHSLKLKGPAMGDEILPYQFIDIADITGIEEYRADLESHPAVEEVHGHSDKYVQTLANLLGVLVEPGAGNSGGAEVEVVWYSRLQPGIEPSVYEDWVRQMDYPGAATVPSLKSYRVFRVEGAAVGEVSEGFDYDYYEVAEVVDMEQYLLDLEEHPAAQAIVAEIGQYVRSVGSAWGSPVRK
jgi:hypothetical protein